MSINIDEQYDKIYKYCYFKVNNKELAQDITQETFLKYFEQKTYISRGKLLAYLYTIARNLCNDNFRKNQPLDLKDNDIVSSYENDVITSIAVQKAIETLTDELQEIVLLRFSNELQVNEISTLLGISRFVVMRKIKIALKELNKGLREEDFFE